MADAAGSTSVEVQPNDGAEPRSTVGAVLVVGGGVSGIQASLDLAGSGFKVYLVEEGPSIGGRMAQLDKTFPTNECSMCILSPKLIDCERNPNIEIITLARVAEVAGEVGNFTITLVKRPRFVNEEDCTGCGTCADYCPLLVADPFNEGLSQAKCIHVPFAQAVPAVSVSMGSGVSS
jgi:heterodisulfide reductase subunit A